jgi:hypothetical protein
MGYYTILITYYLNGLPKEYPYVAFKEKKLLFFYIDLQETYNRSIRGSF